MKPMDGAESMVGERPILAPRVLRTREIEELLNLRLVHPVSLWMVPILARWGISPNMVSLAGTLVGLIAAVAIGCGQSPPLILLAGAACYLHMVLDGADGQLARFTGQCTPLGQVLDGVCDYIFYVGVYIGLLVAGIDHFHMGMLLLAAAGGLSHAVQAARLEFYRYEYDLWGHAKGQDKHLTSAELRLANQGNRGLAGLFGTVHVLYVAAQETLQSRHRDNLRKRLKSDLADADEARAREIRSVYRDFNAPQCRRWGLLSDPERLIVLLACLTVGQPLAYFVLELTLFNLWMLFASQRQRHADRAMLEWLEGKGASVPFPTDRPSPDKSRASHVDNPKRLSA
jgi:hypothetical protein